MTRSRCIRGKPTARMGLPGAARGRTSTRSKSLQRRWRMIATRFIPATAFSARTPASRGDARAKGSLSLDRAPRCSSYSATRSGASAGRAMRQYRFCAARRARRASMKRGDFLRSLGDGAAIMIKAVAGGGGRGMRAVSRSRKSRRRTSAASRRRARHSATATCTSKQLMPRARHIEVQIIGDGIGQRQPSVGARMQHPAPQSEDRRDCAEPGSRTPAMRDRLTRGGGADGEGSALRRTSARSSSWSTPIRRRRPTRLASRSSRPTRASRSSTRLPKK